MSTTTRATAATPAQLRSGLGGVRLRQGLGALPWLAPARLLILAIVLYPAGYMVYTAFQKFTRIGVQTGPAGWDNFRTALTYPGVPIGKVFANTFIWVAVVTALTILISLGLAQFLNKSFPGRKIVRLAVVVPWAASVVMTTSVFFYGLNPDYGIINRLLVDVGILDQPHGFTKTAGSAFAVAIAVAVFVSLPFTTYTILSGLQAVPDDVLEAAHMDGAGPWSRYLHIVLPMLRSSIAVATLIMIINVFNSLPILRILVEAPGYDADITTTLIFKYRTLLGPGVASALSVVNFLVVLAVIAIYLAVLRPTKER